MRGEGSELKVLRNFRDFCFRKGKEGKGKQPFRIQTSFLRSLSTARVTCSVELPLSGQVETGHGP